MESAPAEHGYAQTNLQLFRQLEMRGRSANDVALVRRAYELATRLFSARFRPNGKPFVLHLVGTASILERHGAEFPVTLAGLLHAAYAQGDFGSGAAGVSNAKRQTVRDVIGAEAEELVAGYTAFAWPPADWSAAAETVDRRLLFMRLANELEECLDDALRHCASSKRDRVAERLPSCVDLAKALGLSDLARELEQADDRARRTLAEPPGEGAPSTSYTLTPLSHGRRTGRSVRGLARRLLAKLGF